MNLWHRLSRYFPRGFRRSASAHLELAGAYERLFTGHGSDRDAGIVLTDIANWTGFYRVSGPGLSAEDRAFADGQRAAFGRLFRFLRLSDEERRQLEEAARAEAIVDVEEGNF